MSRAPIRKGWCPSLYAPMQTHDGWLVRVTPSLGGLTADQTAFLAGYAARYGSGRISLTSRANLQLRGLDETDARAFAHRAVDQGLGLGDAIQEARRRILFVSPLAGLDPGCAPGTLELAREIEQGLKTLPPLWRPPEKFSLAVDGGGMIPVGALRADLALRYESGAWRLHDGEKCETPRPGELTDAVLAALLRISPREKGGRALHRMPRFTGGVPTLAGDFLPGCFGAIASLGMVEASTATLIADTARLIRLTPWRGIVLDRPVEAPDLITDRADIRVTLVACPGEGYCAQAHAPVQNDALSLAPELEGRHLHVSGCAKGCASRDIHDVTLVAGAQGYDLIWRGRVSDRPAETGLGVEDVRSRLRRL